jgi:hypothetical protein
MQMGDNKIIGSKVGGKTIQETDAPGRGNLVEASEIDGRLSQRVSSQPGMRFGPYRATGLAGIVAIVVIFIAYYVYSYFAPA